jgi:hypothetical protein
LTRSIDLRGFENLGGLGLVPEAKLKNLMGEVDEIVAMTVQSIKTLRAKSPKNTNPKSEIQNRPVPGNGSLKGRKMMRN